MNEKARVSEELNDKHRKYLLQHKRTNNNMKSQHVGFNGGVPITEEFFVHNISGKHNEELSRLLLTHWDLEKALKFMDDKETLFRRLCKWIDERGLKRAAVTNAPRSNAELLITMLGLTHFFETVV